MQLRDKIIINTKISTIPLLLLLLSSTKETESAGVIDFSHTQQRVNSSADRL